MDIICVYVLVHICTRGAYIQMYIYKWDNNQCLQIKKILCRLCFFYMKVDFFRKTHIPQTECSSSQKARGMQDIADTEIYLPSPTYHEYIYMCILYIYIYIHTQIYIHYTDFLHCNLVS